MRSVSNIFMEKVRISSVKMFVIKNHQKWTLTNIFKSAFKDIFIDICCLNLGIVYPNLYLSVSINKVNY